MGHLLLRPIDHIADALALKDAFVGVNSAVRHNIGHVLVGVGIQHPDGRKRPEEVRKVDIASGGVHAVLTQDIDVVLDQLRAQRFGKLLTLRTVAQGNDLLVAHGLGLIAEVLAVHVNEGGVGQLIHPLGGGGRVFADALDFGDGSSQSTSHVGGRGRRRGRMLHILLMRGEGVNLVQQRGDIVRIGGG